MSSLHSSNNKNFPYSKHKKVTGRRKFAIVTERETARNIPAAGNLNGAAGSGLVWPELDAYLSLHIFEGEPASL